MWWEGGVVIRTINIDLVERWEVWINGRFVIDFPTEEKAREYLKEESNETQRLEGDVGEAALDRGDGDLDADEVRAKSGLVC